MTAAGARSRSRAGRAWRAVVLVSVAAAWLASPVLETIEVLAPRVVAQAAERPASVVGSDEDPSRDQLTDDDLSSSVAALAQARYAATSADELEEIRRAARERLIADAQAAGVAVDPALLAEAESLSEVDSLAWPLESHALTDVFGTRGGAHMGIDLAAPAGTPIGAAAPGVVVLSSESHFGYGVAVVVQHVGGLQTVYGHMSHGTRTVRVGDWVETGDHLGGVGNTGRSFGDHLHFEVRLDGTPIDPMPLLTGGSASPEEIRDAVPAPPPPEPAPPVEATFEPAPAPDPAPSEPPEPSPSPTPTPSETPSPEPEPTESPPPDPTPTETPPSDDTPDAE